MQFSGLCRLYSSVSLLALATALAADTVSVVRGLFAELDPPQNLAPRSDDILEIERQMDRGIR